MVIHDACCTGEDIYHYHRILNHMIPVHSLAVAAVQLHMGYCDKSSEFKLDEVE